MRILIGIILFIVCFGSNSCQKEFVLSDIDSSLLTKTGDFTAKIDGVQFVADKFAGATKALGVIGITGQDNSGQQIVLTVGDSGVHVYTLGITSIPNLGAFTQSTNPAFTTNQGSSAAESGGTVSITSIDEVNKTLSGTFSITVFRQSDSTQKIITEGVFNNISYETQALPPANASDTFRVKIDGVDFPVFSIEGISAFDMIDLSASDQATSKTVGLSFPSTITPGTYNFDLFQSYVGQYNIGTSYLTADNGSFTILENNSSTKRVKGTFSFHASELLGSQTADLTEGYFSVVYQ